MNTYQVSIDDIEVLVELFDSYRLFYQQVSDIKTARRFLRERIENDESVIFLTTDETGRGLGFTQLYPTFSSVRMTRLWILNDLFVAENARKRGVANLLMQAAEKFVEKNGGRGLSLSTAIDNDQAQALYEKRNWKRVEKFINYNKTL